MRRREIASEMKGTWLSRNPKCVSPTTAEPNTPPSFVSGFTGRGGSVVVPGTGGPGEGTGHEFVAGLEEGRQCGDDDRRADEFGGGGAHHDPTRQPLVKEYKPHDRQACRWCV